LSAWKSISVMNSVPCSATLSADVAPGIAKVVNTPLPQMPRERFMACYGKVPLSNDIVRYFIEVAVDVVFERQIAVGSVRIPRSTT